MVAELIDRLDRWLSANRPDYYLRLQPGTTDAALDGFQAQFSLTLPESFRLFFKWRNGQDPQCSVSFQDNRMFSALEEISETKEILDAMIGSDFESPRWWRRSWVPFLANGGGDHLCLDLAAEDGGQPGQLLAYWHDWEKRSIEHSSFEEWLQDVVCSMEAGTLELA